MSILSVKDKAYYDNSITNAEKHTHLPYSSTSFNKNDEIRIPIQQTDVYTLPSASSIYIEGKIRASKKLEDCKVVNNGFAYLFDEIRYEIGGKVIDRVRNPGITTTLKGYVSYNGHDIKRLHNAGWSDLVAGNSTTALVDKTNGNFSASIPLSSLLGFAEDFQKIIINLHQELVLVRSSTDNNVLISQTAEEIVSIEVDKVVWKVPHIQVSDIERLKFLKVIDTNAELEVSFRSWDLNEMPAVPMTTHNTWAIKSTNQLEKPRYAIVAFQTNRKNLLIANSSVFDSCKLNDIKLHLNSEMYPYDSLNIKFSKHQFAALYDMYADFQKSYYDKENHPVFGTSDFEAIAPITVINCSHQNELISNGTVDIRLDMIHETDVAEKTICYCLLLHDRVIRYSPLSGLVYVI